VVEHSSTADRYLEAIFYIDAEGDAVRPSRLASWLGVRPPTVTQALARLERDGFISTNDDRSVTFTHEGRTLAANVVRRHRILERWLTQGLGLDWATADEEAERLASSFSDLIIDQIDQSLGFPDTCPHGNVIPGRVAPYGELTAVAVLTAGSSARVRRISEIAEHDARVLLARLAEAHLHENSPIVVSSVDSEVHLVVVGHGPLTLSHTDAALIWVDGVVAA